MKFEESKSEASSQLEQINITRPQSFASSNAGGDASGSGKDEND